MSKGTRTVRNAAGIKSALRWAEEAMRRGLEGGKEVVLSVRRESRRLIQNDKMWAMLGDVSKQVEWHGLKLSSEDWKNMFTAGLKRQRTVPNLDNTGFVMLGESTSRMTVGEMAELIEFMLAWGAEKGVRWTAPKRYEQ